MSKLHTYAKDFITSSLALTLMTGNAQDTQSSYEEMRVRVPLRGCSKDHKALVLDTRVHVAGTFSRNDGYQAIKNTGRALSRKFKTAAIQITADEFDETLKAFQGKPMPDNAMGHFLLNDVVEERANFKRNLEKLTQIFHVPLNFTIVSGASSNEPYPDCIPKPSRVINAQAPDHDKA